MSTTEPSTDASTAEVPIITRERRMWPWILVGTYVVALIFGFVGGIAAHALFPVHDGKPGKAGKQGPAGEAGPMGPAGNPSNINLSTIGYCVNVSYNNSGTVSFVDGVYLSAPTVINGVPSCPTGTFTPLQPTPQQ